MTRHQAIQEKLALSLHPVHLDVENESRMHSVPPGSETHFKVMIVSEAFEGLGLVERHRRVNEALADELRSGLHALTIRALTPSQWSEQGGAGFQSPACLGGFEDVAPPAVDLTLALISDLHFGPEASYGGKLRKLTAEAAPLARAFVERMNTEVRPDLVVNLGDDIEDESPEADRARYGECQKILASAQAELVNVAGNHDTARLSEVEIAAIWGREGALYYSLDRGGFHLIVLHTRERKDHDVSLGDTELEWLARELAANPGPTIVLMHHSAADQDLTGNRWFEGSPHICLVRERRAIRKLFEDHGDVRAVFNGHLHWNHLDVIHGIPYITLQSLIENLDEDAPGRAAAAYAVVRASKKRIVVEVLGAERARYQFDSRKA